MSLRTVGAITVSVLAKTVSSTIVRIMAVSIVIVSIMTVSIMTVNIMTVSITTVNIMTVSITTVSLMTVSILTVSITALSIPTLNKIKFSIMSPGLMTQHKDTLYNYAQLNETLLADTQYKTLSLTTPSIRMKLLSKKYRNGSF
jgi:hypothetical protein